MPKPTKAQQEMIKKLTVEPTRDTPKEKQWYDIEWLSEEEEAQEQTGCPHANKVDTRDGDCVCMDCGLVLAELLPKVDPSAVAALSRPPAMINNYQTVYQFNQIMRRLQGLQRPIPDNIMELFAKLFEEQRLEPTKANIYRVCREIGFTHYQKKWIEIRLRLRGIHPVIIRPDLFQLLVRDIKRCQIAFRRNTFGRKIFPTVQFVIRGLLINYGIITPFESYYNSYFPAPKCKVTQCKYDRILPQLFRLAGVTRNIRPRRETTVPTSKKKVVDREVDR